LRLFTCQSCQGVLFFENSRCTSCERSVGYCAEAVQLVLLPEPAEQPGAAPAGAKPAATEQAVEVALPGGKREPFVRCKNYAEHDTCNWLVRVADGEPYCLSCRLTEVIPDLSDTKNRQAWAEVEGAKRRLLYTLQALRLAVMNKHEDADAGLAFRFLQGTPESPVTTGHADGLITLNIAEADAAYRENMREKLGEAYRTVLGHLRHEIGHYYWDRLIRDGARAEAFRELFGDESASYEAAIQRHYGDGPPANWAESFISAYATMHPWEDWAETWAHYLHMRDTLETARSHGLTVRVHGTPDDAARVSTDELDHNDFEALMSGWQAVTVALNSLSRSMGMHDVYPFVVSKPVRDKLRFVHDVLMASAGQPLPRAKAAAAIDKPAIEKPLAPKPAVPAKPAAAPAT